LGAFLNVASPTGRILTVNAGSSSLKLRILDAENRVVCSRDSGSIEGQEELRNELAAILTEGGAVDAAGHRVVHGGPDHDGPALLDASVEEQLDRLADLAPLHNPPALEAIRALEAELPGLPNVACFDTAFHAGMPAAASTYAVPAAWSARWPLRRYGFHGLSHAYASRRAAQLLGRPQAELRLVTAHLGAGASLAAVQDGRSVDTTMGFTPLEGLVMATRSGSVDPGLLLWVQRHGEIGAEEMERVLDRESGLLGLSGHSGDMREVIAAAEDGDERSRLALDVYIHRLAAGIASMAAAMEGIDALVFTGGVGENSARVRSAAAGSVAFLGVELDPRLNDEGKGDVLLSAAGAAVPVVLIQAREDIEIAAQVRATLGPDGESSREW
jgi:acetate kinase